jgi:glycosyl transferase, family 25
MAETMPSEQNEAARPMPIYVINLDRSQDRLAAFLARNAHLADVTRARAVDGALLDRADLIARGIMAADVTYSLASLGCAISHACLWQVASGRERPVTLAEDDAIFRLDFEAAAHAVIAALPADWDLILWGWNFNSMLCIDLIPGVSPAVLIGDQNRMRQGIARFQAEAQPAHPFRLLRAHGGVCYSLSPAGAGKLRRLCLPIRQIDVPFPVVNQMTPNTGIDMTMSLAYPLLNAFVSLPPLVLTENRRELSTIQDQV